MENSLPSPRGGGPNKNQRQRQGATAKGCKGRNRRDEEVLCTLHRWKGSPPELLQGNQEMIEELVQHIRIITGPLPNNNCGDKRGNFPVVTAQASTAVQLCKRLRNLWNENRIAHRIIVELPNSKWQYKNSDFPNILTKHIGATTLPTQTMESWCKLCLEQYNP